MSLKILVVDSNEIWRIGISKILAEKPGIEVIEPCSNISECMEKVARFNPDVVLLDTDLYQPTYTEVIQRIQESVPKVKVLMLTHSDKDSDVYHAIKAGASGYVCKEVKIDELVKAVFTVESGEPVLSPAIATKVLKEFIESYPDRQRKREVGGLQITERERQVLDLVAKGKDNRTIASILCITENTVKVHLRNIMEKTQVHNRLLAASIVLGVEAQYPRTGEPTSNE